MTATLSAPELTGTYAVGIHCTWHGFMAQAKLSAGEPDFAGDDATDDFTGQTFSYCCPNCGGALREVAREAFLSEAAQAARRMGNDYDRMLLWSEGKCFPDTETLINAWRQAADE